MERLSAEDRAMLWPDEVWPQDIGVLAALDGGVLLDGEGHLRIRTVRRAVAGRLHLVPRFRQLLAVPPRGLGGPLWVDAPRLDLADHVREQPVPGPGDEAALLRTVERLRRRRLDRSRPLWEMWFLTGLADGRVGLFVRLHHAIADGMAGVATMAHLLDTTPDAPPSAVRPWTPAPPPAAAELRADKRRADRERIRSVLATLAHPLATARSAQAAWPAIRELLADRPPPVTSLHRLVGADRALALVRADLGSVQVTAHRHGATVNDVLLGGIAGGVRALLVARGEPVDGIVVRAYVPVSLHREPRGEARGNLIAQIVVPLPIGVPDAAARLEMIASETARRKARRHTPLGRLPMRGLAGAAFLALVKRQRVNITSADLPGPATPLYLAGARVLEVFPMVQLLGTVSLAVGALSYDGQFTALIVADRDGYPDVATIARGVADELTPSQARHAPPVGTADRGPGPDRHRG